MILHLLSVIIEWSVSDCYATDIWFGSYGRVPVSTDLSAGAGGGHGSPAQIVSHGPRVDAEPYLELDFKLWRHGKDGDFGMVFTPAVAGELFAYSGVWDTQIAIRNLYAEAEAAPFTLWAGARMYRGSDLFLLDFWPLNDLNIVGGGAGFLWDDGRADLAVGFNRLRAEEWQYQIREVPEAGGTGTEEVLSLDRQRVVGAASVSHRWGGTVDVRPEFYLEGHFLPRGDRYIGDLITETLPSDGGLAGGLSLRLGGADGWGTLWYRAAGGLAVWDELEVPEGAFNTAYTTRGASLHRLALEGGWTERAVGVIGGGYVERRTDADGVRDADDRWEASAAVRAQWLFGKHGDIGLEFSQQVLAADGINPRSQRHEVGQISRVQLMPAYQMGWGHRYQPQLRIQYSLSVLNEGARLQFPAEDLRSATAVQHRLGLAAEWWFSEKVK